MVCVGPERVDDYEAEGFLVKRDDSYIVIVVERDNSRGIILGVWFDEFSEKGEAKDSLKDILYTLGRIHDRGFGCHEAISVLDSKAE